MGQVRQRRNDEVEMRIYVHKKIDLLYRRYIIFRTFVSTLKVFTKPITHDELF